MKTDLLRDVDIDDLIFAIGVINSIDSGLYVSDENLVRACIKLSLIINTLDKYKNNNNLRARLLRFSNTLGGEFSIDESLDW